MTLNRCWKKKQWSWNCLRVSKTLCEKSWRMLHHLGLIMISKNLDSSRRKVLVVNQECNVEDCDISRRSTSLQIKSHSTLQLQRVYLQGKKIRLKGFLSHLAMPRECYFKNFKKYYVFQKILWRSLRGLDNIFWSIAEVYRSFVINHLCNITSRDSTRYYVWGNFKNLNK